MYEVSLKKIEWKVPFVCVKVDILRFGSKSGLSCWIFVSFGVVITLQVNANETFATYYHVSVCLYVYTIHSAHNNPLIIILSLITIAFRHQ